MKIRRYLSHIVRHYFNWLPDESYLRMLYLIEMGKPLHLKEPKTFQEKIQWLKLYNRNPEYTKMVDKYAVKEYVGKIIGDQYIIPTLGVWDNFDDIDFDMLPDKFVLKTTHGGGSCGVVVCNDKNKFDYAKAKSKLERSLKSDIFKNYREWPYKDVPRRIIAEKYLEIPGKADLTDYKFFCFNGEPKYIQVIQDRNTKETIDFFDTEWSHQKFVGLLNINAQNTDIPIPKPRHLDEMLRLARQLAIGKQFVRVDLYQIENAIYFGEITYYPASGLGQFMPIDWNMKLGNLIHIVQ